MEDLNLHNVWVLTSKHSKLLLKNIQFLHSTPLFTFSENDSKAFSMQGKPEKSWLSIFERRVVWNRKISSITSTKIITTSTKFSSNVKHTPKHHFYSRQYRQNPPTKFPAKSYLWSGNFLVIPSIRSFSTIWSVSVTRSTSHDLVVTFLCLFMLSLMSCNKIPINPTVLL